MCVTFPTNSLVDSYEKELVELNSLVINQFLTPDQRTFLGAAIASSRLILTTYHSFHKVAPTLTPYDLVVFDEFHSVLLKPINDFTKVYKTLKARKLHLTATPLNTFYFANKIRTLRVLDHTPKPKLKLYTSTNNYQAARQYIYSLLPTKGVHMVFLNNKEDLSNLATEFAANFEVQTFASSDTIRQSPHYLHFKTHSELQRQQPDKPLLVLATSFVYEGVSFLNKDIETVAIFGENTPQHLIQALKRTRNYTTQTKFTAFLTKQPANWTRNFVHTQAVINQATVLANGMAEEDDTLRQCYEEWVVEDSFTNWFNGVPCYFKICMDTNKGYLLDTLRSEFMVSPFIEAYAIEGEGATTTTQQDRVMQREIDTKAYEILVETPQKAADFVFSNTENLQLKKWLKNEWKASFTTEAKEFVMQTFELEKYYSLVHRLHKVGMACTHVETLWKHRRERKSEKLLLPMPSSV